MAWVIVTCHIELFFFLSPNSANMALRSFLMPSTCQLILLGYVGTSVVTRQDGSCRGHTPRISAAGPETWFNLSVAVGQNQRTKRTQLPRRHSQCRASASSQAHQPHWKAASALTHCISGMAPRGLPTYRMLMGAQFQPQLSWMVSSFLK